MLGSLAGSKLSVFVLIKPPVIMLGIYNIARRQSVLQGCSRMVMVQGTR